MDDRGAGGNVVRSPFSRFPRLVPFCSYFFVASFLDTLFITYSEAAGLCSAVRTRVAVQRVSVRQRSFAKGYFKNLYNCN
ncbi:hypothetical protein DWUX_155 [Desulfovibrio diazotrophicus]|nr:hypothetical protein DWUX_155 [Desulfovibrio diazotrophicus]